MPTFTWKDGSADWGTANDWTGKKSARPPGSTSSVRDTATLGADKVSYAVTVGASDAFNIATLNIAGQSTSATTGLDITGSLMTNTVSYSGTGGDAEIDVSSGGFLDIRTGIASANGETLTIAGTGAGGHLELGSASVSGIDINGPGVTFSFSNNPTGVDAGEIEFNGPDFTSGSVADQVITNVAAGDKLVFDGADFTGDTVSLSQSGALTVTDTADDVVLTMNNVSVAAGVTPTFSAVGDTIEATAPCYAAGTHILTPSGEVPIENLAIGDLVVTRSGEARAIKWIGRRSYQGRFISGNHEVLPICIAAGALADGIPKRDLNVSPGHAMLMDDVLVPAENLINGITIRQIENVDSVEYIHLELDTHDVIFAEGAPAETYVDCDNRNRFQNPQEFAQLYPDADPPKWAYCAPWIDGGEALERVRQKLDERLASLGFTTSVDPDLHLLVDGCIAQPDVIQGSVYVFRLTKQPADVRILSRASIPAHVCGSSDRRQLGAKVSLLVLRSETISLMVEHGHPLLAEGFHRAEATHRWTDGDARIPPEFLACFKESVIIEVRLLDKGLRYRLGPRGADESLARQASVPRSHVIRSA